MTDQKPKDEHPNAELLQSATKGFEYLFSNDIVSAREHFKKRDDPFHMMGLGVCGFLEAALGMESGLMTEASRCLSLSEAGTRKYMRTPKPHDLLHHTRFHHGLEWEILNADAVVLLGLTHALSESYMGYLQCMYSLNSAHSKFTKLYKTVFPNGLPTTPNFDPASTTGYLSPNRLPASPSLPASLHNNPSMQSLTSLSSGSSVGSAATIPAPAPPAPAVRATGLFSRWMGASSVPSLPLQTMQSVTYSDGPVEDLIIAGTAFGFGLFNLVFSLLPKKVQGLVGFFGFKHDRQLALKALSLSASKEDVHGVFAGLVLMTYHGVVLLLSGYQANEDKLLAEYRAIVDKIETRYPQGALWILNRAKIMRMAYNADGAILVLRDGLKLDRKHSFVQADMLLIFELAWTLLSQRRYQEAADTFLKITELNSWSHGTYYFIAAGCHFSLDNYEKTQTMLDMIPDLIDKKKISGKDLPTEVFIKKKLAFWKEKQVRRGGDETKYVEAIKISPAEEIGIFWNNHARIAPSIAQAHLDVLNALTPPVHINRISPDSATPSASSLPSAKFPHSARSGRLSEALSASPSTPKLENSPLDLDNSDELAIRALLLGINYRTTKEYEISRGFLNEAFECHSSIKTSMWVAGVAMFELAVLDLKEAEEHDRVSAAGPSSALPSPGPSPLKASMTVDTDLANGDAEPGRLRAPRPRSKEEVKSNWVEALKSASYKLDIALGLATSAVDLSSRLDSRIAMLRDEIATKKDLMGVSF